MENSLKKGKLFLKEKEPYQKDKSKVMAQFQENSNM